MNKAPLQCFRVRLPSIAAIMVETVLNSG